MKRTTNLEVAREIRRRYAGGETQMELAVAYDLAISTVSRIVNNLVWKEAA